MTNLIITGPTASGKSNLALKLAKDFDNIELISADAFQVYKGLDIGTAKPTNYERQIVKHHLIDINEPTECYTSGIFVENAEKLIENIRHRGKIPVIVGGTGLYIKSLSEGIFDCPKIDDSIRKSLHLDIEKYGLEYLYKKLLLIDNDYATRISCNDPVRIIRALEVYEGLGITFTEAHIKYKKNPKYKYYICVLTPERDKLYENINLRTKLMWQSGWVEEVKTLLNNGVPVDCPAFRAIGYKEVIDYINDSIDEEKAIYEISKQTRHFAKRQYTWFRGMKNINYFYDNDKLFNSAKSFILGG